MTLKIGVVLELKEIKNNVRYFVNQKYIKLLLDSKPENIKLKIIKLTYDDEPESLDLDGVFLIGGGKFSSKIKKRPTLEEANPERYNYEKNLIKYCKQNNIPIFGICRGHQTLNEVHGGEIEYIDKKTEINHNCLKTKHKVKFKDNSLINKIFKNKELLTNSLHLKEITKISEHFSIVAESEDGIIEAIESKKDPLFIGVQWHPEALEEENSVPLIKHFLTHCLENKTKDF